MNEPKNKFNTTERDIFLDAIDIADPSEREVFLTKACDGNSGLRA